MTDTMSGVGAPMTRQQTARWLQTYDRYLLLCHAHPDGDTLGSAMGLRNLLRHMGKTAHVICASPVPFRLSFITEERQSILLEQIPGGFLWDKIISVDVASPSLLGAYAVPFGEAGHVDLAIDHHPSFEGFGKANIVRPEAAACGELLYDILASLGPITAQIALPLYVAVSTDTGCFAYNNTGAQTHAVAAALMRTGIDFKTVNKVFFRTKTRKRMQLEGAMLSTCEFFDRDRVAVLSVPISLMERLEATESDAEELSSLGGQIEGTDCAVTFRELRPDVWKMSVRTGERINATKVCAMLGGGGHAAAAGCTVEAPWQQVKEQILAAVAANASDFEA